MHTFFTPSLWFTVSCNCQTQIFGLPAHAYLSSVLTPLWGKHKMWYKTNNIESCTDYFYSTYWQIVIKSEISGVKRCDNCSVFCVLIAADYWINSCCQSKGTSRVSPHTLRLAPATPWCDWRSSCIVIRNERVCWENCLWWLRRIIFNTLQVSNKQMKRTLQIITNVLACLKCMLWLPVIVFFLCSRTSPSFYFSLSHGSVLPHSFHISPTYSLFPSKSPAGVHACVFMRLLVCVCVLHVDFFHHHRGSILPVFITTVGSCTSSRRCALQKIHYGGSGSRGPCIQVWCPGAYSGEGMGFLCIL